MGALFTPLALACAAIALAGVLANFVLVALRYGTLPDRVPRHYGITGRPDAWSGKPVIWVYPSISLIMVVTMACVGLMNAQKSTPDEARTALRQMSLLAAFLSALNLGLTLRTFAVAEKRAEGLGRMFLPGLMLGIGLLVYLLR